MRSLKVCILIPDSNYSAPDSIDTLEQAQKVQKSLINLDHKAWMLKCSLNLKDIKLALEENKPDLCFNLIEHLEELGSLQHLVPSLLDALKIPYTGSSSQAILTTTDKLKTLDLLKKHHLIPEFKDSFPGLFIIKPRFEDASIGIDEESIVYAESQPEIQKKCEERSKKLGFECFFEPYIDGREFNVSLLKIDKKWRVLPIAELVFKDYQDRPKILGYDAKWDPNSFAYNHVFRVQNFLDSDAKILDELTLKALKCADAFKLNGYFRVDFRVDANLCYPIDVNTNPGIGDDTGFVAACEKTEISYDEMIAFILHSASTSLHAL